MVWSRTALWGGEGIEFVVIVGLREEVGEVLIFIGGVVVIAAGWLSS